MRHLMLAAALTLSASGAAAEASWRWTAPEESILIGVPVTLEAVVDLPEGYRLLPIQDKQSTGAFEILDIATEDGRVRLKTAAFALGKQTLPALRWTLRNDAGKVQMVESPPVSITLIPPKPVEGEAGKLRDIKEPLGASLWPLIIALAILFLVIGAIGYWFEQKRKRGQPSAPPIPVDPRTPEEIAFQELDALADLSLPVKEYYDQVSDVLRAYLERRLSIPALSMTTVDLRRALVRADVAGETRQAIKALLNQCDLAKFARYLPSEEESSRAREDAKDIVKRIAPKPKEIEPAAAS